MARPTIYTVYFVDSDLSILHKQDIYSIIYTFYLHLNNIKTRIRKECDINNTFPCLILSQIAKVLLYRKSRTCKIINSKFD